MHQDATEPAFLVVMASGRHVVGIDRRTGQRAWTHDLSASNIVRPHANRVLVDSDKVFVVSSHNHAGTWASTVRGKIQCLDLVHGRLLWEHTDDELNCRRAALLVADGQLLVGDGATLLAFAIDAGVLQWRTKSVGGSHGCALAVPGMAMQIDWAET